MPQAQGSILNSGCFLLATAVTPLIDLSLFFLISFDSLSYRVLILFFIRQVVFKFTFYLNRLAKQLKCPFVKSRMEKQRKKGKFIVFGNVTEFASAPLDNNKKR